MYAKNSGAARRCFSAIPEKPVGAVKMTPPTRAKVKRQTIVYGKQISWFGPTGYCHHPAMKN